MIRVVILLFLLVFNLFTTSFANDDISVVIDLYKSGKYQDCVTKAEVLTKSDPTSVLGYYYMALSYVKLGKKDLAIKNYDKVIALGTNKALTNYAKSGKSKLQKEDKIAKEKENEKKVTGADFMLEDVDEEKKTVEPAKTEEKSKKVEAPQRVEEAKKVQPVAQKSNPKTNNGPPTNDEIVNAIRVLQRAGLWQSGNSQPVQQPVQQTPQQYQQQAQQYQQQMQQMQESYMDPRTQELQQMLMMMNSGNNNNGYNNGNDMMQMLPYLQNGGKMSPQMIQMMMMKNSMPNFSSGNNNGY